MYSKDFNKLKKEINHGSTMRLKLQLKRENQLLGHLIKVQQKIIYFTQKKCEQRHVEQSKLPKEHLGSNMSLI